MKLQKLFKKLLILNVLTLFSLSLISQNVSAVVIKHANVVFVGEFGSGKSAITNRLYEEYFDYDSHVPGQFSTHKDLPDTFSLNSDFKVKYDVWDNPGREVMREQILDKRVTTAHVVVVVVDAGNGDPADVVRRAFTEWLPEIKKRNKNARILFVFNKMDIPRSPQKNNAADVLRRCASAIDAFSEGSSISALYVSSKGDYCVSRGNENIPGTVRNALLEAIAASLRPIASTLPNYMIKRNAICPKCNHECSQDEIIGGECRECRRRVCHYCHEVCYKGAGSYIYDEHPYCCQTHRDKDSCLIM